MKSRTMPLGAGMIAAAFFAIGSAAAQGNFTPQTISYASFVTPQLGHSLAVKAFFEAVSERTDGAITFEPYWQGALCSAVDMLECVTSGQADMVFGTPVFTPAELPLTTIGTVPFQTGNNQAASSALLSLFKDFEPLQSEWANIGAHVLWFGAGGLPMLGATRAIETLDDLKGRSVRTVGYIVKPMAALGANPVSTAPAEMYEAVQRGVVDGVIYTAEGVVDSRLYEVVDYLYDIGEYMGVYSMQYYAINSAVWEGLSPELQEIFTEEAERISARYQPDFLEPFDTGSCELITSHIESISRFGDEPSARAWADEQREAAAEEWISSVGRSGVKEEVARALLDGYRSRSAELAAADTNFRSGGQICREMAASR